MTGQLARSIDAAYAAGQAAVDAGLFSLERLHAGDPPAEHADIELFIRQWNAVRDLLSPLAMAGQPAASVTASIGVAGFPAQASTLDRLERLADAALYLAKRQGRNRVELADPAPAEPSPANGAGPSLALTQAAHGPQVGEGGRAHGGPEVGGAG